MCIGRGGERERGERAQWAAHPCRQHRPAALVAVDVCRHCNCARPTATRPPSRTSPRLRSSQASAAPSEKVLELGLAGCCIRLHRRAEVRLIGKAQL
eukprot:354776-Chlamydomonas_euryale.AAC.4